MTTERTELRQVNIQLPAGLHKRLRIRAIEEERSMSKIMSLLLEGYLAGRLKIPERSSLPRAGRSCPPR